MAEIMEFLKIYKDFGVAGLFLALELVTIWLFYKELKNSKDELVAMTKLVTMTLDNASTAIEDMNTLSKNTKQSVDDLCNQSKTFQAFLQGRDENRDNRRSRNS